MKINEIDQSKNKEENHGISLVVNDAEEIYK